MKGAFSVLACAAAAAFNFTAHSWVALPFPPPDRMRLAAEDAVTNASLMTLGMRRLAADIMLVRLLVYYGTKEEEMSEEYRRRAGLLGESARPDRHHEEDGHGHDGHDHGGGGDPRFERVGHYTSRGVYPDLGPRARRMVDMDPFWSYPALYVAGALAFNQDRPEEAAELLRYARSYLPEEKRYLIYTAAIAFHRKGDMREVVTELTPLLEESDASTMIKNMVAFMNVRLGNIDEAVRLYRDILDSRDEKYHETARRQLIGLTGSHLKRP